MSCMTCTLDAGMIVVPIGRSLIFLSRKIELPFVPADGMGIRVYSEENEVETYYIENLVWDPKTHQFYSMTKHIMLHEEDDPTDTVEFWKSLGWQEVSDLNEMVQSHFDYERYGPRVVKP